MSFYIYKHVLNDEVAIKPNAYKNYRTIRIFNSKGYGTVDIRIGEDYTTIAQANAILAIMGLNYELVESTDWLKVEVGTKIRIKGNISDRNVEKYVNYLEATFYSYFPNTNQIIVMNGNKVEVYNEGDVSLIWI